MKRVYHRGTEDTEEGRWVMGVWIAVGLVAGFLVVVALVLAVMIAAHTEKPSPPREGDDWLPPK